MSFSRFLWLSEFLASSVRPFEDCLLWVTFIELALLFGWDFYLLPYPGYAEVFVSHDEFLEFHTDSPAAAEQVREAIEGATIEDTGNSAAIQ